MPGAPNPLRKPSRASA